MQHTKLKKLMRVLAVPQYAAVGLLECLWHLTAREAPAGNIGKLSNEDIAITLDWEGDHDALVSAFVATGWLDEDPVHRLLVHDWSEHADDATKKAMSRQKVIPAEMSRQVQPPADKTRLPEPVPEPVPEPEPVPLPQAAAGARVSADEDESPTPGMVASGVMLETGLSGWRLQTAIEGQVKVEEKQSLYDPGAVRERMIQGWRGYQEAWPRLNFPVGAERFFGEGLWRDPKLWPYKKNQAPKSAEPELKTLDDDPDFTREFKAHQLREKEGKHASTIA